jgi:hypothetical protein
MISSGQFYSVDAIQRIMEQEAPYSLSSTILNIIQDLENEITHSMDIPKPRQKEYNETYKTKSGSVSRKLEEKWETIGSVKPNIMNIQKEGFEKQLADLRGMLNKISTKTYNTLKEKIIVQVKEIICDETQNENAQKIVEFIFDTAISNKFYSELYSQLYKELIDLFDIFNNKIEPFMEQYIHSFHNIVVVDQNEDYDGFCENNKKNEKRKATTVFMANLLKHNVIGDNAVVSIILEMQALSDKYVDEENKKHEVEEITENLFLLISSIPVHVKLSEAWKINVEPVIFNFAKLKSKDKLSLSNRVVFKYMDIVEKHMKN